MIFNLSKNAECPCYSGKKYKLCCVGKLTQSQEHYYALLHKEGIIKKKALAQHSRGAARILHAKKKKGRKRGMGKRTGRKNARQSQKENWVKNVRAQRRMLKELKKGGATFKKPVRQVYLMIKGNYFKGKKYLLTMVEEAKK